jgi:indole-3-acetate monooxygenase
VTAVIDPTVRGTDDSVLGRVRALLPDIAARASEAEAARAVPAEIVAGLRDAGVFRMALPKAWGGE